MGRGRAKAKQQKVARELKYSAPATDLSALERELHANNRNGGGIARYADPEDEFDDEFDDQDDDEPSSIDDEPDDPDDDYGKWAAGQR